MQCSNGVDGDVSVDLTAVVPTDKSCTPLASEIASLGTHTAELAVARKRYKKK